MAAKPICPSLPRRSNGGRDLFPIAETLQMLRFADVGGGDIRLTEAGKDFAADEMDERKQLFRRQLLCYVPLAQHVRRVLDVRPSHTAPEAGSSMSWRIT